MTKPKKVTVMSKKPESKKKPVHPGEWKWFGTAAHYICGRHCRFHLATRVGIWLVSTVGEKVSPHLVAGGDAREKAWLCENWPGEDIGAGRKYETLVFLAGKPCDRVDCFCGLTETDGVEVDFQGYNVRGEATEGHMEMCKKWADRQSVEFLPVC